MIRRFRPGWLVLAIGIAAACAPRVTTQPAAPLADPEPIEVGVVPPPGPYAPGFDALHYRIALDLPAQGGRIDGETQIAILLTEPRQDTLRLDLTGLRARSVRTARGAAENLRAVPFYQAEGRLVLPVPATARTGDTLYVTVAYGGTPTDGLIIRDNVHGQRSIFADNWPNRARFWFPSIDHPSDKALVSFDVRAPAGWRVIANGRRVDRIDDAFAPGDGGRWRYDLPVPIPTYLMVIGATVMTVETVTGCADGGAAQWRPTNCVAVTSWAFPPDSAHASRVFRRGGEMIEFYSRLVGPFPYTKLAHVQSSTRFGGMENAGAIFYSERAIADGRDIEGTVAHETAHQWFGNSVTPHSWHDLWLSEGFATYYGALFFEHVDGSEALRQRMDGVRRTYLASDVHDLAIVDTTAVPGNNLLNLLNRNSYQKGGAVLHMLRGVMGDDDFFRAVRDYYGRHQHGTARTADLQAAMTRHAGRDMAWFFEQWVFQPGFPRLRATMRWNEETRQAEITIEQTQPAGWPTFRLPMDIVIATALGPERRSIEVRSRRETFRFPLAAAATAVRLDPDGWLLFEEVQ
jgi:aminopeptidase N